MSKQNAPSGFKPNLIRIRLIATYIGLLSIHTDWIEYMSNKCSRLPPPPPPPPA